METIGGDGSETGLVTKKKGKQQSTTGIGASLAPDYRTLTKIVNNPIIASPPAADRSIPNLTLCAITISTIETLFSIINELTNKS